HLAAERGWSSGVVRYWDAGTGREVQKEWPCRTDRDNRIGISPDGRLLAVGVDYDSVRLLDTAARKDLGVLPVGDGEVRMHLPTFAGRYVAVNGGGGWHLWDIPAGKKARV